MAVNCTASVARFAEEFRGGRRRGCTRGTTVETATTGRGIAAIDGDRTALIGGRGRLAAKRDTFTSLGVEERYLKKLTMSRRVDVYGLLTILFRTIHIYSYNNRPLRLLPFPPPHLEPQTMARMVLETRLFLYTNEF